MALRVVSPWDWPCSVSRQRQATDRFAQIGEADAGRAGALRNEAVRCEAGERIGLQAKDATTRIHAEVDAAVAAELERAVSTHRGILQRGRERRRQLGGELFGHAGRV